MKHIWWATIITIWLATAGWATLTVMGQTHLATSIALAGFALGAVLVALLMCGLFSGALDD